MLLYYITDRRQFPGSPAAQRAAVLRNIFEAARCGVDFVQLREKDLSARELLRLAEEARAKIIEAVGPALATRNSQLATRLLINSRIDVALGGGADGVHLRADDVSAADARAIWMKAFLTRNSQLATGNGAIAASCHTADEVGRAASEGADFVVYAPVFEKGGQQGVGLEALRTACRTAPKAATPEASPTIHIPVLALGGITPDNAGLCLAAGAAGVAGIRLFQDNDIATVVERLRALV